MSGQDEKIGIIETARSQYGDLMQTLRRANPSDPYSLLPPALERSWKRIKVPSELKPDIKKIANRSIFDDGMWGPVPERYR